MTFSQARYMQGVTEGKGEERENIIVGMAQEIINNRMSIESCSRVLHISADEFINKAYLLGYDLKKTK